MIGVATRCSSVTVSSLTLDVTMTFGSGGDGGGSSRVVVVE